MSYLDDECDTCPNVAVLEFIWDDEGTNRLCEDCAPPLDSPRVQAWWSLIVEADLAEMG